MIPNLHIRIISPQQILFEGDATSLTSTNSSGKFDILPGHANFITLVETKPIVINKFKQGLLTFNFPLAIIYCSENKVNIYTHIQSKA